jgi:hypothetical protein
LSPESFKELIFGYQMAAKHRLEIIKIIKRHLPHLNLYEAQPHEDKFLIEIRKMDNPI